MITRSRDARTSAIWTLSFIMILGGCASQHGASTSGDQSTSTKGNQGLTGGVETVHEDRVVSKETAPSDMGSQEPSGEYASNAQTSPSDSQTLPASASKANASPSFESNVALEDIYFDFDQFVIRGNALAVLNGNAASLRQAPSRIVTIEGHCDERGTQAYNLVLGEKRASAAKDYLKQMGIPASQLHTMSYGEMRPLCQEHNERCWQQNRRAHFVLQ